MFEFSRVDRLPPYAFNVTAKLKAAAISRGEDIIDLSMGNPDGPTPASVVDVLEASALEPKAHGYSISRGIPELREAICAWYQRRYGVSLDSDTEAIATIGSKEGIAHLMLAALDRGDTVLVPNPSYPIHIFGAVIAGANVKSVPIGPGIDFLANLEQAIAECSPKPKMMILGFPSNPTAECADLAFFERVVALAKENNIMLVHDLAYADIVFDDYKAPSILQVPGAKDVAVEFFTMSKSYNMAGWRVGYMAGNPQMVDALARIKSYHDYGMFRPIQLAAAAALGPDLDPAVENIRKTYEKRRDLLVAGLHEIGWMVTKPKASMYIWAEIPDQYKSMGAQAFFEKLLNEARVAVSPGTGFGENGDGFVRFALIEDESRLRQALKGISEMFNKDKVNNEKA